MVDADQIRQGSQRSVWSKLTTLTKCSRGCPRRLARESLHLFDGAWRESLALGIFARIKRWNILRDWPVLLAGFPMKITRGGRNVPGIPAQLRIVHETPRFTARFRNVPVDVENDMRDMTETKERIVAALLPASVFVLCLGMTAAAETIHTLPVDRPAHVMGISIACTGIGQHEENEARWRDYPVKLEAVGGYGQYLAGEEIALQSSDHAEAVHVKCDAPWVLMRLDAGNYTATVTLPNAPAKEVSFTVPRDGQRDVIVRFPSLMVGREQNPAT
jgi:hypothetical protein